MQMQAIVIGLGQFGAALARSLVQQGVEVIGVDHSADRVQAASAWLSDVLCFDARDESALLQLAPERRDLCVCALGDEAREASILVTAQLRQMGAPYVAARATDDLHERVLRLVGAHEVVRPERDFGERYAMRLAHRGLLDVLPLAEDVIIGEVVCPPVHHGRALADLNLPTRRGISVVAVRREVKGTPRVKVAHADEVLREGDVLVLVGHPDALARFSEDR